MATEAGFFEKWSTQQYHWTTKQHEIKRKMIRVMNSFNYDTEERNFSYDQLELVHIDEHFYLLFIGSALSLIVFLCEVVKVFWWRQRPYVREEEKGSQSW